MTSAKEIRKHINSVAETKKITNAMYLISSAKLRKAKREYELTLPYFTAVRGEIKRIFRTVSDIQSRYFYPDNTEESSNGTYAYLVITADKGLAGAYNQNVIREAERLLSEHADSKLFVVGEYGRQYFLSHGVTIEKSFLYTAQNPTFRRAREISAILIDEFCSDRIKKIYVIYTDYKNGVSTSVNTTRLLPFHKSQFTAAPEDEKKVKSPFEFIPSVENVLENIIPGYVEGFIFSALIDSFCCEQNCRMNAMDNANKNAEKMMKKMVLEYNHMRQNVITQEITEVSMGAKYQNQNFAEEGHEV